VGYAAIQIGESTLSSGDRDYARPRQETNASLWESAIMSLKMEWGRFARQGYGDYSGHGVDLPDAAPELPETLANAAAIGSNRIFCTAH